MRKGKPVIGLALGSGGARGWAHLGVLRQLTAFGIRPDVVVGTSMGALIGAAYAAGHVNELEQLALGLDWKQMLSAFIEFNLPRAGLLDGVKIERLMNELLGKQNVESLPLPYGAVATDLDHGTEVVLRDGDLFRAIRASISIPGIFTPVLRDGKTLVDGGLVNPVPVSVARSLGADRVIAVEINLLQGEPRARARNPERPGRRGRLLRQWQTLLTERFRKNGDVELPGLFDVLTQTVRIMENQITRRRLDLEPPDVLIQPRVGHIRTMDFQTAGEGIAAGEAATLSCIGALRDLL